MFRTDFGGNMLILQERVLIVDIKENVCLREGM